MCINVKVSADLKLNHDNKTSEFNGKNKDKSRMSWKWNWTTDSKKMKKKSKKIGKGA